MTTERELINLDPAFPHHDCGHGRPLQEGMTLRDYFAAKAMQGLLDNNEPLNEPYTNGLIAEAAYRLADAMIKEGKK